MLRAIVMLLVLANGLYFAWSQGFLVAYGFAPVTQGEPQRLTQQIQPEAMRVLPQAPGRELPNPNLPAELTQTAPAAECLQAGVYTPTQMATLTASLAQVLPEGSWAIEPALEPARWIVYMGRYADTDAAIKKRGELRGLGVASELVTTAPLAPGLSLGGHATQAEALADLALVSRRGVKTAGVRQERAEVPGQRLKLPAVSPAMRSQLDSLKPQLAGKALQACTA